MALDMPMNFQESALVDDPRSAITADVGKVFGARYADAGDSLWGFICDVMKLVDTPQTNVALERIDADMPNIAEYFRWFNETDTDEIVDHTAVELYLELGRYLDLRGLWTERQHWGWMVYDTGDDKVASSDVRVLNAIAVAYQQLGHTKKCLELYELAIDLAIEQNRDRWMLGQLYDNYATALWHDEQLEPALTYAKQAIEIADAEKDERAMINATVTQANVLGAMGEFEASLVLFQKLHTFAIETSDLPRQAETAVQIGLAYFQEGYLDEAGPYLKEALDLYERLGDEVGVIDTQLVYAMWQGIHGDPDESTAITETAVQRMEQHDPAVFASIVRWYEEMEKEVRTKADAPDQPAQNGYDDSSST